MVRTRAQIVNRYFGVTQVGNFEGKSILHRPVGISTRSRKRAA